MGHIDIRGANPLSMTVLVLHIMNQVYGAIIATSYEVSSIVGVTYGEVLYSATLRSKTECVSKCSEAESCRSTVFDPATMDCIANRFTLDLSGMICGSGADCSGSTAVFYAKKATKSTMRQACYGNSDCVEPKSECRGNQCLCEAGYSYNENSHECVASCISYGDTFQPDYEKVLYMNNNVELSIALVEDCLAECVAWTSFVCKTVEFEPGVCIMQDYTKLDHPDTYRSYSGYTLYTRDCL